LVNVTYSRLFINKISSLQFNLVCRWAFPTEQGGIPMHNYFLLQMLNPFFKCKSFTFSSIDYNVILNNGVEYEKLEIPFMINKISNMRGSFIKNITRSISDRLLSKEIDNKLIMNDGLVEFMDIHSEGFTFLKNRPNKRNRTIIRAHTPFGLLRKYLYKEELKGVDGWFAYKREKKCFKWAGQITTPSEDLKNKIIDLYNIKSEKIYILPNIIDTNHFRPMQKSKSDYFKILYIGRFERTKGVETLTKAFINLSKIYNNIKLINVGEARGPSLKKCMKWIDKEGLSKNVQFTGFVKYEELPSYYASADVVIIPSEIYESFSYTVAQGMACGKPVIASKIGGIPETLDHGNSGILFSPGDIENLSEKIKLLYNNKEKARIIGENARLFCSNNFSMEILQPKYLAFYQSILK
tara:strand:- start:796 stop:2025 length:1230 start_codon:yes stop_codon:yes gene_type:complete